MSCDLESNIVAVERVKRVLGVSRRGLYIIAVVGVKVVLRVLYSLSFKLNYILQGMI